MNITDLITGGIGSKATTAIANTIGVSESKAKWIVATAVPLMIAALNYNAKNKGQQEAIDNAIDQHGKSNLLDQLGSFFGGENTNNEGSKIVQHMFGSNTSVVKETMAEKSGLSQEQVGGVLATLAPLVMSFLGQQKSGSSSGGGIGDLIGSIIGGSSSSNAAGGLGGLLSGILGGGVDDNSASSDQNTTDILGKLAGDFFNKDQDAGSKGNILANIAEMFTK